MQPRETLPGFSPVFWIEYRTTRLHAARVKITRCHWDWCFECEARELLGITTRNSGLSFGVAGWMNSSVLPNIRDFSHSRRAELCLSAMVGGAALSYESRNSHSSPICFYHKLTPKSLNDEVDGRQR